MSQPVPGTDRPWRIAVVGAGPAGIYVVDQLIKRELKVSIDLWERQPAPYGLIRYGVSPDHPRIKGIVKALHQVLDKPQVRLFGNVEFGRDISLADIEHLYDAVVFTTGAEKDRPLDIPGIELPGSFGAAAFVSWFDGHPDVARSWPLQARSIAIIGAGNVALDVSRMLSKTAEELLATEIPANVYEGLAASPVQEVHVFARRGPAQAKFTPLELRELDHSPNVEVIVEPEDIEYDEGSLQALREDNQTRLVVKELEKYAIRDRDRRRRKLYLHFFHQPLQVLGGDRVEGLRTERTELTGDGNTRGTGRTQDWPVQAVYRAVGYKSTPLPGLPWQERTWTVPHDAGRVLDGDGLPIPGVYVNGWVKRGPVGLIGHTKGDAIETVDSLVADLEKCPPAVDPSETAVEKILAERGLEFTTWQGWGRLDAHEQALGQAYGPVTYKDGTSGPRERVKVIDREAMLAASRQP